MKINFKVRAKNPFFWIGLLGVILTAMGIDAEMMTSWGAVADALLGFISNPFLIGTTIISVVGVFFDPTTSGIADSEQALTYTSPKKDGE